MEATMPSLLECMERKNNHSSSLRRVLIIEEHAAVIDMLRWAFRLEGYNTVVADSENWIEELIIRGNDYSAILLDLSNRSWLNRDTIIQCLEKRWRVFHYRRLPLIVLTTSLSAERHVHGYPLIHKPFHVGELLAKVESLAL